MPGERMSTTKQLMPSCFGAVGSVRARHRPKSASRAIVVQTFWPFRCQPPSTRSPLVVSDARSEPAPGSLNSWHQLISPRSDGGIQRCCCSAVPWTMSVGSTHAATCRWGRRMRAARSSSSITNCSTGPASRPHGRGHAGAR